METRLGKTCQIAERLGISTYLFACLVKEDVNFPKPVRESGRNKWWDYKAINEYLDKKAKIEPESLDYDEIVRQRIAKRGGIQNEVRC